jgi:uncharacterized protein (UPF0332 family)
MTQEHAEALAAYRLGQAEDALCSAEKLLASGLRRDSVNRSYYAMFYAVLALLVTRQVGTSKHQGAISLFDREFVKKGVFPKDFSRWLHKAFERRIEVDYGEMVEVTQGVAMRVLEQATEFVDAVRQHLRLKAGRNQ